MPSKGKPKRTLIQEDKITVPMRVRNEKYAHGIPVYKRLYYNEDIKGYELAYLKRKWKVWYEEVWLETMESAREHLKEFMSARETYQNFERTWNEITSNTSDFTNMTICASELSIISKITFDEGTTVWGRLYNLVIAPWTYLAHGYIRL
jgi:hypothetical protein